MSRSDSSEGIDVDKLAALLNKELPIDEALKSFESAKNQARDSLDKRMKGLHLGTFLLEDMRWLKESANKARIKSSSESEKQELIKKFLEEGAANTGFNFKRALLVESYASELMEQQEQNKFVTSQTAEHEESSQSSSSDVFYSRSAEGSDVTQELEQQDGGQDLLFDTGSSADTPRKVATASRNMGGSSHSGSTEPMLSEGGPASFTDAFGQRPLTKRERLKQAVLAGARGPHLTAVLFEKSQGVGGSQDPAEVVGDPLCYSDQSEEYAEEPLDITPHEYTLPNTFAEYVLRGNFAWTIVGAAAGTLAVMIHARKEAGSFDKMAISRFLFQHGKIVGRYPAWGVVAGLGMANVVMPLLYGVYALIQCVRQSRRSNYQEVDNANPRENDPRETHERVRNLWLPSESSFLSIEMRALLGMLAFNSLGGAYLDWVESPFVSDVFAPGIGTIGAVLAMAHHPAIARAIATCFKQDKKIQKIESRHWYKESRHDVPWYTRLFFGAYIGFVLTAMTKDSLADDFIHTQWKATLASSIVSFFVPHLWSLARKKFLDFRYGEPEDGNHRDFTLPAWNIPSQMDLPGYLRVAAGVVASATIKLSIEAYLGRAIKNAAYWVVGGVLPFFLPVMYAFLQKIKASISCRTGEQAPLFSDGEDPYPPKPVPPRLGIDTPLEVRVVFASLAGMMIGQAIEYAKSNTPNEMHLPLVFVVLTNLFALLAPVMEQTLIASLPKNVGDAFDLKGPEYMDTPKQADLNMPFYVRMLMGAWAGAKAATAFGNFFPSLGDPADVVSGFIGPQFIGVSNAVAAPTGAIVGASVALMWPLIVWSGKKAGNWAIDKVGCAGLFSRCCPSSSTRAYPEAQTPFQSVDASRGVEM